MARNNNSNNGNTYVRIPDIAISNAHISSQTNFSGLERERNGQIVNSAGNRNFCIDIPSDGVMVNDGTNAWKTPEELIEEGWPVRIRRNTNEGDAPSYYMAIRVRFDIRPPVVYLVIGDDRKQIGEDEIDTFDGRSFTHCNLIIHPSIRKDWNTGETKITPYLKEGWFYLLRSPFEVAWDESHAAAEDYDD
jgi:hypothetical protein